MSTKIDFRAKYKEKYKEYCDLQEQAKNETDIEKRNEMITKLSRLNLNLDALNIIAAENKTELFPFIKK